MTGSPRIKSGVIVRRRVVELPRTWSRKSTRLAVIAVSLIVSPASNAGPTSTAPEGLVRVISARPRSAAVVPPSTIVMTVPSCTGVDART